MSKTYAIAKKELHGYFKSPIAYIVLFITIAVFNIFFFVIIDQNREATLRDMFKLMEFMFIFIIPLLTMRVFAEEKRAGTMEFLMTCPVKNSSIVAGKYLGSVLFFTIIMCLTLIYYVIIEYFAQPDRIATIAGYFGLWLEGILFIAIGIFLSSLTKNQLVAAISGYAVLLFIYFSITAIKYLDQTSQQIITYIGFWSHSQNIGSGLISLSDLIYYISGIVFCLILTKYSIENRP